MADWIQQNFPDIYRIGMQGVNSWPDAIYATLYMTVISFIIGGLLGLVMGLFLVLTGPRGVIENKFVFQILDKITSIFRAIPFIILLAILKGFTYFIVGTNLGMTAALVPLSAATFPFLLVRYRWYLQILTVALLKQHKLVVRHFGIRLRFTLVKVYLSWSVYQP